MNLIKKATTQVRAKVTKYEISHDEEYDELLEKYKSSKKNSTSLQQELKNLSNNLKSVGNNLQKISQIIATEYDSSDPIINHITQLNLLIGEFQVNAVENFDNLVRDKCIAHSKNYCMALDGLSKTIESRDKAKYDYDDARYKLTQLLESKKPVDQFRFKSAQNDLQNHTANYNAVAYQCKKEIYELVKARAHNATLISLSEALAQFSRNVEQTLGKTVPLAGKIAEIPVYQDRYPDRRETVQPVELTQQPQAGFLTAFNPSGSYNTSSIAQPQVGTPREFDTEWYYLDRNLQQQGPVSFDQLKILYKTGVVTASTHVFGGEMTDWQAVSVVKNLTSYLS